MRAVMRVGAARFGESGRRSGEEVVHLYETARKMAFLPVYGIPLLLMNGAPVLRDVDSHRVSM
jgi:hypothetical protein